MSFSDDYNSLRRKRKKKDEVAVQGGTSFEKEYFELRSNREDVDNPTDIAPVKTTTEYVENEDDGKGLDFFQPSKLFDDGYQFGDVAKTILGTVGDTAVNLASGFLRGAEGISDLLLYGVSAGADALGADDFAKNLKESTAESQTDQLLGGASDWLDDYSVLGRTTDSLGEAVGQIGFIAAGGSVGGMLGLGAKGTSVLTSGSMFASSMGGGMGDAYQDGATDEEAVSYGIVKGAIDTITERLFAGLGKGVGTALGKPISSLDDAAAKTIGNAVTKAFGTGNGAHAFKTIVQTATKGFFEGSEEVLAGIGDAFAKKATYMSDEELGKLLEDQNLLEQFVVGTIASDIAQVGDVGRSIKSGRDVVTGFTADEQAVVDKIYQDRLAEAGEKANKKKIYDEVLSDLEKGRISIDTIEEVLGGEDYKAYHDFVESEEALQSEFDELNQMKQGEMTGEQIDRRAELKEMLAELKDTSKRDELRSKLDEVMRGKVTDSVLGESYAERARRGQAFEADVSQYDAKHQATIQRAIDSGILNNTRRTHEFVEMIARISAEKGVSFDFSNNARLKESGFALGENVTINGYVTENGDIVLNTDSAKSMHSVTGHEVTHILEGTELYDVLQSTIFEYAKTKGEYDSRLASLTKLYEGKKGYETDFEAKVRAELTADLVGDYLFTDTDFINNLSTNHRNLFQKIFDEIKYLCKIATAGSKEARELEKVKKAFEDAYRESAKTDTKTDTQFSLSKNITDVSTGYAHGETYFTMSYTQDGKEVATLEYGVYEGEPNVKMIEVDPEYRRQGIATQLLQALQKKYPDTEIHFGMSTPDGTKLLESITYDVTDDAVVADRQKLKDLQTELNELQEQLDILYDTENLTEEQEAEMQKLGDRWEEVYHSIIELEPTLRGKKATKTFVKTDTQFSLTDNTGRELSPEQQDYFKDSKMRDADGNLQIMYHGSPEAFTRFDKSKAKSSGTFGRGFYFTNSESHAGQYGNTYEVYLNITNPLQGGTHDISKEQLRKFVEAIAEDEDYGIDNYGSGSTVDSVTDSVFGKSDFEMLMDVNVSCIGDMSVAVELFNKVNGTNYDGIITPMETVVFSPEQIKRTDNTHPTADPDTRYSLSDETDTAYMDAVERGDMATAQTMVTEAAKDAGYDRLMFHETAADNIHIFDISRGTHGGTDSETPYGIFTKSSVRSIGLGGKQMALYVKAKNTFTVENRAEVKEKIPELIPYYDELARIDRGYDALAEEYEDAEFEALQEWMEEHPDADMDVVYPTQYLIDGKPADIDSQAYLDAHNAHQRVMEEWKSEYDKVAVKCKDILTEYLRNNGYDSMYFKVDGGSFGRQADSLILLDPNQVKSAAPVTYDDGGKAIPLSQRFNASDNDIRHSLSYEGETHRYAHGDAPMSDLRLEQDVAPVQDSVQDSVQDVAPTKPMSADDMISALWDEEFRMQGYDPNAEADATEEAAKQAFNRLRDKDAPPETEAPYYGESEPATSADPMADRDWQSVGDRSVKAFMYEHPDVKPFFQAEANALLGELYSTTKGERHYNDELYYNTNGEKGWYGTKRFTSDEIAYLLDGGISYAQLERGLNAIIEGNGAENNAVSKRIELVISERLLNGYTDFTTGVEIPPNQDYISWVNEQQHAAEYADSFAAITDADAPISEEIAPIAESQTVEDVMPIADAPIAEQYEAIRPKQEKQPRMARATPAEQAANAPTAKIVDRPTAKKKKDTFGWFREHVLSHGAAVEDLALEKGNRELQARFDNIRRAENRAQTFMTQGKGNGRAFADIQRAVEKSGKADAFNDYVYHYLNIDRMTLEERFGTPNKAVFGDSVTAEDSRRIVAELEKANPEFKAWAEDLYAINRHLRGLMVEEGIISAETAELWDKMYPHYVPISREGYDDTAVNVPLDTGRTGVNAPIKKATGGNRNIYKVFGTMGDRISQTYRAIARNRFGVELRSTLGVDGESSAATLDETIDSVDKHEELLQEGKDGHLPTFTVFENGERVKFEIPENIYEAMKPSQFTYTNGVANKLGNIRRDILTTYSPSFMLTNPIKDVQDIVLNSQHPLATFMSIPEAIYEVAKKGRWYQERMENGGMMDSWFYDSHRKEFAKEKTGIARLVGIPIDKFRAVQEAIEQVPRMAEYIASRKKDRSIDVSMLDAGRVTTNFGATGDLTNMINRNGFTFFSAGVEGFNQQARNIREAKAEGFKGWCKLLGKYAVAGLPAILLNSLLWDDDEEYEELSDYVKQNYYVVAKFGDGQFVRIPKGRAVSAVQEATQQMVNLVTGNDEVDLEAFGQLVANNILPPNPLDNNILSPIIQAATNKTWYGDDLVPTRLQDVPAAEQFDETTDAISKWLGEATNTSPYKWNYVLDQYLGGIGDIILPMSTPKAESGADSIGDYMLAPIRDKFTTDSVLKNQNVSDFYDTVDELAVKANSSKATDEDVLKYKYVNSVNSDLGKLYQQKRELQNSDMPNADKYNAVREIQRQIDRLAENALNSYNDVSVTDNYAKVGDRHYRWYEPSEDSDAEAGWQKISDKQLAKQNNVTRYLGITASEYWGNKEEYDYAYDNPEKYAVAKAVGGYSAYKGYSKDLYDIKADKDADGKSISGSRKEKVIDYVNSLDIDYGEAIILFKSEYTADDTYNNDIIDYLNDRDDISYDEMVTILKELGFTVYADGTVTW